MQIYYTIQPNPTENRVDVRKGIRSENFAPIINQMDPNSHTPYRLGRRPGQQGPRTQLSDRGWGDKSVTERTNLRQIQEDLKFLNLKPDDTGRRDMWRQRIRVADPPPAGD